MKLIREFFMPTDNDYCLEQKILESKEGEKSLVLRGIFAQAEVKNRNGRIYPLRVLESECYNMQKIIAANGGVPGELDHPKEPQPELKNAAILIKSIKQDGNNFIGEAKVLSTTTHGVTCMALAKEGLRLGTSTRGLGELMESDGQTYVKEGYKWLTNDVVGDPSAPLAWCESVLEGKHYELTNGVIQESTILEYKSAIHTLKKEQLEEGILDLYKNFLNEIDLKDTKYKFKRHK
ncbi:MAG: hypothetical protein ACFFKA_21210 [Candidatus Thorarchaeota archaeon]